MCSFNVSIHVKAFSKGLRTEATLKGSDSCVGCCMTLQSFLYGESFITDLADVRFFTCMREHVLFEGLLILQNHRTDLTLCASIDCTVIFSSMFLQILRSDKGLVAVGAREVASASVTYFVISKVKRVFERSGTLITLELLLGIVFVVDMSLK